jgi:hypothetical protein
MHFSNLGTIGLTGFLLFLAGLHILWQGREEVFFWTGEFLRIFRGEFTRRAGVNSPAVIRVASTGHAGNRYRGTLRLIAAFGLMALGPLLFLFDLRF